MALRPRLAMAKDTTLKMTAHALYLGPWGKSCSKVSAQLVTRPTEVFRQAIVTVAARIHTPASPK